MPPHDDFQYDSQLHSHWIENLARILELAMRPRLKGAPDLLAGAINVNVMDFTDFIAGDWVISNHTIMEEAYNLSVDMTGLGAGSYKAYVDAYTTEPTLGVPNPTYQAWIRVTTDAVDQDQYLLLGTITWDGVGPIGGYVDSRADKWHPSMNVTRAKGVLWNADVGGQAGEGENVLDIQWDPINSCYQITFVDSIGTSPVASVIGNGPMHATFAFGQEIIDSTHLNIYPFDAQAAAPGRLDGYFVVLG